ncbi:MAG: TetR/AcrR family transcriptional regulator [Deltaproteobacteria bacterium]|nr:TetR/AcrR family transcriptional regulator [Candidatus Zymogenaceae bacterium]
MPQPVIRARTEQDKEQKRQRLMSAAMDLFIERGYKIPTVEMIAERAGTSVGTFYLYFKGKREIYKIFQGEGIDILSDMIFRGLAGQYESAREKLAAAAASYLHFYREYPEYYGFISLIDPNGPDETRDGGTRIRKIVDVTTMAILRRVEAVITEGVQTGEFRPMDPWKTACALWGMIDGFIIMEERSKTRVIGMTLDEIIAHGLETAFSGMTNRGGASAGAGFDGPVLPVSDRTDKRPGT